MRLYGYRYEIIIILTFNAVLLVFGSDCSAEIISLRKYSQNKVTIKADNIVGAHPGSKPITLSKEFIKQIIPELNDPRYMIFSDVPEEERHFFIENGYTYILKGDFNGDKYADIAFVGKYEEQNHLNKSFFAIISFKENQIVRELFMSVERLNIFLINIPDEDISGGRIGLIYRSHSEDCGSIYWKNDTYWYEDCVNSTSYDVPGMR